ncbi:MAG: hypothetical protein Q9164_001847 [Protoblastenia rupestris]
MSVTRDEQSLKQEIARLESELYTARNQLSSFSTSAAEIFPTDALPTEHKDNHGGEEIPDKRLEFNVTQIPPHPLLHLTDTALPLGSFAFSSGLESYLAHHKAAHNTKLDTLPNFLQLSLTSLAATSLPYLINAYKSPARLEDLDDTLDACTLCPVAKRASISQGRALITVWEKALRAETTASAAKDVMNAFCASLKSPSSGKRGDRVEMNGHFPLIYALVCCAQGLTLHETAYTFLFNHAKAVASAAVRASVLGPYAAQGVLGSKWLRAEIETAMKREWERSVEDAAQGVPVLDVWIGRHELLYSRIFNS